MNLRQRLILILARTIGALCVVLLGMGALWFVLDHWSQDTGNSTASSTGYSASATDGSCNIAVIPLQGDIISYDPLPSEYSYVTTSGDAVVAAIKAAEANSDIKGIMLQIDSGGGAPAASEQIMKAMQREQLPTAAYIREMGDSGAYMAATGANTIIASDYADVGSIGITESYVQNSGQNAKNGLQFISLSSGPYKDALNPDNPITPAQQAQAQQQIDDLAQVFIGQVAQNRHIAVATVKALADGSSVTAKQALKDHLIDAVGDDATAAQWFTQKIGTDAVLCDPTL